jgi:hypothetical protein
MGIKNDDIFANNGGSKSNITREDNHYEIGSLKITEGGWK